MSAHVNFVQETSVTTGTGDVTLSAKVGFPRFLDALTANDTVEYSIDNGNQWETGLGTIVAGNILERTTVYATYDGTTYDDSSPAAITLAGSSTVYGTNTAQNINDPTVNSLTVNDDGDVTLGGTGQLLLPQVNSAANPTLAFGDGNSGLFEQSDNILVMVMGTSRNVTFHPSYLNFGNSSFLQLQQSTPSATTPVFLPQSIDPDTGIGKAGADALSLISGGVEGIRVTEVAGAITIDHKGITVYPKASGNGIKVDNTTPTFGFADLLGDQFTKNTGATKPTLATYNGAIQAWQFAASKEAYITYHIPHDYVIGTDIYLHIHWTQTSATVTGGTLDFKYFAIYAKGHNQASGSAFTTTPITATFTSVNINDGSSGLNRYQNHLTEVIISGASATAALFDRDDFEPDGVIELTFEMDANDLTDSVTVLDPFIHFVDIHYQTTGLIGTKDKVPDFYA